MSKDFVKELRSILNQHPLVEKVVITDNPIAMRGLLDALAREGVPWANVFCYTPAQLAERLVSDATFLPETAANSILVRLTIGHLLESLPAAQQYLGPSRSNPGTVEAVANAIYDLRMHGLSSADLRASGFTGSSRGLLLADILEAYEEHLAEADWHDEAELMRKAMSALEGSSNTERLYLISTDLASGGDLPQLKRQLLTSLPKEQVKVLPEAQIGTFYDAVSQHLWRLDLFAASSPVAEIRETLRVLANKSKTHGLGNALVFLARHDRYQSSMMEVLSAFEADCGVTIPCTFERGIPASLTRPGRFVDAYLKWIESGYPADLLAAMLSERLMTVPAEFSIDADKAARLLRNLSIGAGRDRYLAAIARNLNPGSSVLGRRVANGDRDALLELQALIKDLMSNYVPQGNDPDNMDVADLALTAGRALKRYVPEPEIPGDIKSIADIVEQRPLRHALEALNKLHWSLEQIGTHAQQTYPVALAAEHVRLLLSDLRIGREAPLPGHLHVAALQGGIYPERNLVFILGLDESAMPKTQAQDTLLSEKERQLLGPDFPNQRNFALYKERQIIRSIINLPGKTSLTMSYATHELGKNRALFPSHLLLEAYRAERRDVNLSYEELGRRLEPIRGYFPTATPEPLFLSETWIGKLAANADGKQVRRQLEKRYRNLKLGSLMRQGRQKPEITVYDGKILPDPQNLDPRENSELIMSATQLETLAWCPLKYFFKEVLGVTPPLDEGRKPDQWLDAVSRGAVLHEIYRQFHARMQGPVQGDAAEQQLLEEILEEVLGHVVQELPPPSTAVYEREKHQLLLSLKVFHRLEQQLAQSEEPLLFEVAFGKDDDTGPVRLQDASGRSFRISGRIDRINRIKGTDNYSVWDKKTGRPREEGGMLDRGRLIQHVLYAAGAEAHLHRLHRVQNPRVVQAGYLYPTEQGQGQKWTPDGDPRSVFPVLIEHLLDLVANGYFVAADDAKGCYSCEYRAACPAEAAARKVDEALKAGTDHGLRPLKEVRDFE